MDVAPYVGAWIETQIKEIVLFAVKKSHPMWVRGLKLSVFVKCLRVIRSHPMWVRGLKHYQLFTRVYYFTSHPMWVRGLKPTPIKHIKHTLSRTLCGCVD